MPCSLFLLTYIYYTIIYLIMFRHKKWGLYFEFKGKMINLEA